VTPLPGVDKDQRERLEMSKQRTHQSITLKSKYRFTALENLDAEEIIIIIMPGKLLEKTLKIQPKRIEIIMN
jgi:hypothetical protein